VNLQATVQLSAATNVFFQCETGNASFVGQNASVLAIQVGGVSRTPVTG
jgi:hypothetical protein